MSDLGRNRINKWHQQKKKSSPASFHPLQRFPLISQTFLPLPICCLMENGSVISLDNDSVVKLNYFGAGKKTSAPTASQHPSAPRKFGPGQWFAGAGSAVELVLINQRQHGIDHRRCIIGSVKRYAHKLSLSRARRRL